MRGVGCWPPARLEKERVVARRYLEAPGSSALAEMYQGSWSMEVWFRAHGVGVIPIMTNFKSQTRALVTATVIDQIFLVAMRTSSSGEEPNIAKSTSQIGEGKWHHLA